MIRKLTAEQAEPYFRDTAHGPLETMPEWMEFRALGAVCGAFHQHLWPGVWMGHLGVLPGAYRVDQDVDAVLRAFAADVGAERIVGWVKETNRPMLALCRRVGFEIDGRLPLNPAVVMTGWRP